MRAELNGWTLAGMAGEVKVRDPVTVVPALTIPFHRGNLAELRSLVAELADRAGLDDHRIDDLLVVATELATNAVRHAGGSGVLRLWSGGDALYCQVIDDGPGLPDPQRAGVRPVPTNSDEGRGLWLARQLSDELYLVAGRRGTSATATFAISWSGE
ncbi:MAG TPA: ATP-binding protein [Candidatus Limnocylindrales bacterium]